MEKRGVSPLIATVLIIGFTVALGIMIFLWGGDLLKMMLGEASDIEASTSACADTNIVLSNAQQIAPGKLNFLAENTGNRDIKSIIVRCNGNIGSVSINKKGLKSSSMKAYVAQFNPEVVGNVQKIEVLTTVVGDDQKSTTCAPGKELDATINERIQEYWENYASDGNVNLWEECDNAAAPSMFPPDAEDELLDCTDVGYTGGVLACTDEGLIDTSGCTGTSTCGNGVLDGSEDCDNDANWFPIFFSGLSCESIGFDGGQLTCSDSCIVDISFCTVTDHNGEVNDVWEDVENWEDPTLYTTPSGGGPGTRSPVGSPGGPGGPGTR